VCVWKGNLELPVLGAWVWEGFCFNASEYFNNAQSSCSKKSQHIHFFPWRFFSTSPSWSTNTWLMKSTKLNIICITLSFLFYFFITTSFFSLSSLPSLAMAHLWGISRRIP
jgi:hypothetical protein